MQKVLADTEQEFSDSTLLKTIILQQKEHPTKTIYLIVPYFSLVQYDEDKGWRLAEQKMVYHEFGTGSLSPLIFYYCMNVENKIEGEFRHQCLDTVSTPFVIFSSGIKEEIIKVRTEDFYRVLDQYNIRPLQQDELTR